MKKALVLSLAILLGIGLFASAQTVGGKWASTITIDPTKTSFADAFGFSSTLQVDYKVGGWNFTSVSTLSDTGWSDQTFSASGALGAFSFTSLLDFTPVGGVAFDKWTGTVGLSLGGMSLGSAWTLDGTGLSLTLSGSGSTGLVNFTSIALGFGDPTTTDCDLDWQDVKIGLGFPFACADVTAELYFTCDGFQYATFGVSGLKVDTIPWLSFDASIKFELQTKTLTITPHFNFGNDVCFTTWWDVDTTGAQLTINSIQLVGIGIIDYEISGVSFTGVSYWGAAPKPSILYGTDYWEGYKIATTDTGCCGPFGFDITAYFGAAHASLFDVSEFDANMSLQVSTQFNFGMGLVYKVATGVTKWTLTFTVTW